MTQQGKIFLAKKDGAVGFKTNNAGGLLGGISNGDETVIRLAVKTNTNG